MRKPGLPVILFIIACLLVACDRAEQAADVPPAGSEPVATAASSRADAFVDNARCLTCHAAQAERWRGSHHDLAMQVAGADSVLADFNDARFTHHGVTTQFRVEDGRYLVNTEGADGKRQDFEVRYTFGVAPLQQYLVAFPDGRLQALTVAWDSRPADQGGQRWFQLQPQDETPPGDPLHWTGRMHNWNMRCAECHSTNLQKHYDPDTDTYATTWSEINVSCQACHGPGAAHVAWAESGDGAAKAPDYSLVSGDMDSRALVDSCARCHSRRHRISPEDAHGRAFLDDFEPATLQEGLYHPDGQILDEVYVYGSFLQSRMYHQGVSCRDCHDVHSTRLHLTGNALCLQCHNNSPPARFPTLQAKDYDSPAHHFHATGSDGAQCINCHMTAQTYMEVDPRRDHSFRIPRPDLSLSLGVPNACTRCHTDSSDAWAADQVAAWYGTSLRERPHYGEIIAAGRAGDEAALDELLALAGDDAQPAIVQATALQLLARYRPTAATGDTLRAATLHADPLVRSSATSTLGLVPEVAGLDTLLARLADPVRAVRMEAARILAPVPREHLDAVQRQALDDALAEYRETQLALSDTPEGLLNLAVLETSLGNDAAAEEHYLHAIRMAPDFVPARVNLANLYNRSGRNSAAEQQLRRALAEQPDNGELYYSLGLLLAEVGRNAEAVALLQQAGERLPQRARVHYNHGLLLQQLGRMDEAAVALERARAVQPDDADILYALVVFHAQQQDVEAALDYARQLQRVEPGNAEVARLVLQLQQAVEAGKAD